MDAPSDDDDTAIAQPYPTKVTSTSTRPSCLLGNTVSGNACPDLSNTNTETHTFNTTHSECGSGSKPFSVPQYDNKEVPIGAVLSSGYATTKDKEEQQIDCITNNNIIANNNADELPQSITQCQDNSTEFPESKEKASESKTSLSSNMVVNVNSVPTQSEELVTLTVVFPASVDVVDKNHGQGNKIEPAEGTDSIGMKALGPRHENESFLDTGSIKDEWNADDNYTDERLTMMSVVQPFRVPSPLLERKELCEEEECEENPWEEEQFEENPCEEEQFEENPCKEN